MNKKSIKVKAKAFVLPSLAAFKRLSFKAKAIVFRDWAATKKGEYNSLSSLNCALSQFSAAMGGDRYVSGSSDAIIRLGTRIPVIDPQKDTKMGVIHDARRRDITTFPALARRLTTHINKHYGA